MSICARALPETFCWTRFGAEAGQSVSEILARKERERLANHGLFLWGIGNAVGPGIRELVRSNCQPLVLFSPIRRQPRLIDRYPRQVVAWTQAEAMDGRLVGLPPGSLVTSRLDKESPKACHYALVCGSSLPLSAEDSWGLLDMGRLRNLTTGSRVGWSQVTAVVTMAGAMEGARSDAYPIAWTASLAWPYLLRLSDPVEIEIARPAAAGSGAGMAGQAPSRVTQPTTGS